MENLHLSGNGKIVSFSIIHEASDSFKIQVPYAVAIIELDEGTRITGQIVNANCSGLSKDKISDEDTSGSPTCKRIKNIEIGSRVTTVFRKISEDGKSGIIHYGYKFKIVD
jgi:uncharacterized OB-fold protein